MNSLLASFVFGASLAIYKIYFAQLSTLIPLSTEWGANLDNSSVLPEYPRPQFVRSSYMNLNGVWDYSITENSTFPNKYEGSVVVPFSIESPLSGVNRHLLKNQTLWYHRQIDISKLENKGRILIHFGAVDQTCTVFVNGRKAGEHDGGYTAFDIDITKHLKAKNDSVEIVVKVVDHLKENGAAYGKQSERRGGIWYTSTSGIWQTVWLESVPETYLKNVMITPMFDESSVKFSPRIIGNETSDIGKITVFDAEGSEIATEKLQYRKHTIIKIKNFKSWSPESPYLYSCKYEYGNDSVDAYFAMRKFSVSKDERGIPRLFLNNKPYFHNGLLDQGYWSDGYYTAPSDEALKYDILKMKSLGFNMLRKHIKIEPLRWYYHCDKIGMLVWQDAVSGGSPYSSLLTQILPLGLGIDDIPDGMHAIFGRKNELGRKNYYRDLKNMIEHLYNVPSIATWVPFNEGWGQFDAANVVDFIKKLDSTRHIDHASGWHDQGAGDFKSLHVYFKKVRINPDKNERAVVLSEFGGYSHGIEGHVGSDKQFGYAAYKTIEDFNNAFKKLYYEEIIPQIPKGLSATVYTQVSDVEEEVNGILTYDRKVCKADEGIFKEIMAHLKY